MIRVVIVTAEVDKTVSNIANELQSKLHCQIKYVPEKFVDGSEVTSIPDTTDVVLFLIKSADDPALAVRRHANSLKLSFEPGMDEAAKGTTSFFVCLKPIENSTLPNTIDISEEPIRQTDKIIAAIKRAGRSYYSLQADNVQTSRAATAQKYRPILVMALVVIGLVAAFQYCRN
jgi:hypothetical protein